MQTMTLRLGKIERRSFQAFTIRDHKLDFPLVAEEQAMPDSFKEGDLIEVTIRTAHPVNIEMGIFGTLEFVHPSGEKLVLDHQTNGWKLGM